MLLFANEQDVERWLGADAPDGVERLLRLASMKVGYAVRRAIFDVTPAGLPADPDVAEALRDATCAQVEVWHLGEVEAGVVDTEARVSKSSIEGASVEYDTAGADAKATLLREHLCTEAWEILALAGLTGGMPWVQ